MQRDDRISWPVICSLIVLDSFLSILNTIPFLLLDVEIRKSVYNIVANAVDAVFRRTGHSAAKRVSQYG